LLLAQADSSWRAANPIAIVAMPFRISQIPVRIALRARFGRQKRR
jgi:hypothetical protein